LLQGELRGEQHIRTPPVSIRVRPRDRACHALRLARSSYFYHKTGLGLRDKYADVRNAMVEIFDSSHRCYGYRRIHAMLCQCDIRISEKIVRRLMAEEQLAVHRPRRRYSSYSGEIGAAPENLVARDFDSQAPNQKWLTDITEFQLPARVGT